MEGNQSSAKADDGDLGEVIVVEFWSSVLRMAVSDRGRDVFLTEVPILCIVAGCVASGFRSLTFLSCCWCWCCC